jgi:scyllo-inositol 2-dehydrogenase (NADP+)
LNDQSTSDTKLIYKRGPVNCRFALFSNYGNYLKPAIFLEIVRKINSYNYVIAKQTHIMKPVHVALCSFGMSGWVFHAPFINVHPGFILYAVWERTKNLAEQKYAGIKTFRSLEDMLSDKQIDVVIVNTPNYTHFEYTKKALLAGKHVVVEKPFTVTVEEGNELIKTARQQKKLLTVYQNRRYDSDFRTVKKVLDEGWLGELVEVETPGPGTGALYDLGAHLIDQALLLFGKPQSVYADIRIVRPASQVDDYFELLLYYPQLRVRLKSNYLVREALPGYILHGFKGSFIKPKTDMQEAMLQEGKVPDTPGWGIEPESDHGLLHTELEGKIIREHIPSLKGNYGDFYEQLYRALSYNEAVPVDPYDSLEVVHIIEKSFQSNKERIAIEL